MKALKFCFYCFSLELDWNYTSLVVENFIGNPFVDRGCKPGFAEGKRNFCCWSQLARVASSLCPWSKSLRGVYPNPPLLLGWGTFHGNIIIRSQVSEVLSPPLSPLATCVRVSDAGSRTLPGERDVRRERGSGSRRAGVAGVSPAR